ncbi:MAG TPA: type II toxin-antitoxin system VapC family toxin [Polyangiaceae bacterium]|jgi:tRNA(fMet)-specific endonuclease VapC|nr:type II toxin-antitoxin system VapC family toxin [Polyangiaceae bacterium]
MKRLLDTNAYVELLRGDESVASLVRASEQVVFSMIVVGELLFGFRNGNRYERNLAQLDDFLAQPWVALQMVTRTTADRFGRVAAALRKAGTPIPTNDIWIAAHAFETGAEVITFDRHFAAVSGLPVTVLDK